MQTHDRSPLPRRSPQPRRRAGAAWAPCSSTTRRTTACRASWSRDHFYDPLHKQIYETASKLIASGKQANPITLKTFFETAEPIDAGLTVPQYLGRLAANAATIINARDYGRTIHDLATRRGLIVIGEDVVNAAYDLPVDFPPKEQIEEAETRLFALVDRGERGRESEFSAAADAAMKRFATRISERAWAFRLGSRIWMPRLADCSRPISSSSLRRPGMGKSALATNIADNVAGKGTPVGFYSLEMSREQVATRIICARAGLPVDRATRGQLNEEELRRFGRKGGIRFGLAALPLTRAAASPLPSCRPGRAGSSASGVSGCSSSTTCS